MPRRADAPAPWRNEPEMPRLRPAGTVRAAPEIARFRLPVLQLHDPSGGRDAAGKPTYAAPALVLRAEGGVGTTGQGCRQRDRARGECAAGNGAAPCRRSGRARRARRCGLAGEAAEPGDGEAGSGRGAGSRQPVASTPGTGPDRLRSRAIAGAGAAARPAARARGRGRAPPPPPPPPPHGRLPPPPVDPPLRRPPPLHRLLREPHLRHLQRLPNHPMPGRRKPLPGARRSLPWQPALPV